ncbi:hypothetical protein [Streptomyces acidiscabies]|uniref:Uncharacterized protein n=1 Tax=Streptomyces acidiscabies TaxID=42234 RepID=A0AAP6BGQ3_9ACTN|nr:hypothetical protein [Streptomyces acidiscabies]MBP5935370.1 hypothetical protein [Streptomyces sp. LBUM 1476]MBZ3916787.1 hypothetical protein [Streptomyces acidiscabies]MDX2964388.1 hypothetical protein [Streptomyces acidiscabies]MDX3022937.1 hypothetical protein [Streptomyces acidiscabies]MDX3794211.1 hypothetical protein [Streptomyces acidiscabies]
MDALFRHPALSPGAAWPTLRMWVRREDEHAVLVSLAPAPEARPEEVLLPCDAALLTLLGSIALGSSRAGLYAARLDEQDPARRLVLCARGVPGALRVRGATSAVADTLYGRTRSAMLTAGHLLRASGQRDEAAHWGTLARGLMLAKRSARRGRRGRSVRAVSGGLPTLGKRG